MAQDVTAPRYSNLGDDEACGGVDGVVGRYVVDQQVEVGLPAGGADPELGFPGPRRVGRGFGVVVSWEATPPER